LKTALPQEHKSFGNSFEKTGAKGGSTLSEEAGQIQGAQSTKKTEAKGETREVFA
jgi:hypothetical protein